MSSFLSHTARRRFAADDRGNVAIMFGLALLPMLMFAGSAVDYSRASAERTRLQSAVDATGLSLAKEPSTMSLAALQAKGALIFAANFSPQDGGAAPAIVVSRGTKTVRVTSQTNVQTAFMQIAGQAAITVGASSEVAYGTKKIELALVLDNTGSMGQNGKIVALKAAVNNLLTKLEQTSRAPGDIKVSITPFNTQVNIGTANVSAPWLRWDVTLENVNLGWGARVPATPQNWTGCISDRDQDYDVSSEGPSGGQTRYPASSCTYRNLAPMVALTQNLETVRTTANAMNPTGATNVTMGFVTGMSTLRSDTPFGAASSNSPDTVKFLVLLTDGNNTANRFGGTGYDFNPYFPMIDARLNAACQNARIQPVTKDVQVFTVRVMDGNAALLQSCASSPSMYFDVQNAGQLQGVFDQIARAITSIRITS